MKIRSYWTRISVRGVVSYQEMGIERLMHGTAEDLRGGAGRNYKARWCRLACRLRKQIKDELLGLSTHHSSLSHLEGSAEEKKTSPAWPWRFGLSVLKLQTWLLGFTHTATTPSEDVFVLFCRVWVALPRTTLHPASTNHCEKRVTNYTNCSAQFKKGICHTGILVASYIFLLPLSPFCSPPPRSTATIFAALLPPQPLRKLPTPFSPCTGGSAKGSSSSHSS